jgi:hypothetical protein
MAWDLAGDSKADGTQVRYFSPTSRGLQLNKAVFKVILYKGPGEPCQIWKLLPVQDEGWFTPSQSSSETSGSPPSYGGDATGQSSTRAHHTESKHDDFGTVVTEVTVRSWRSNVRTEPQSEGCNCILYLEIER